MTSREECVAIMEAQHIFISASQNKNWCQIWTKEQNELEQHVAFLVELVVWSGVGGFGVE